MSLLLHSQHVGAEEYRAVHGAQAVLVGLATSNQAVLRGSDCGLLYFMNEKQRQLQRCARVDLEAVTPLRLVLEFMSFVVSGLIVEAERIDEAAINVKKDLATIGHDLRATDLDLQYRWEHSGSKVEQAIAQHYKSKIVVPLSQHANEIARKGHPASGLSEFSAILQQREQLSLLKRRQSALAQVQRVLHGSGLKVAEDAASAFVKASNALHVLRKAGHRVKDALVAIPAGDTVPAIHSLQEFVAHVDVGLTAAVDDLEACAVSIKKSALSNRKDEFLKHMEDQDNRNKLLSNAAMRQNEQSSRSTLRRDPAFVEARPPQLVAPPRPKSEMDEFLRLYCSS